MTTITLLDRAQAGPASGKLLDAIQGAFGVTPNMFRAVAHSPAALASMWGSFGALAGGVLDPKLAEQIAVLVAERNGCEYCLAAHTALGRKAGASAQEMQAAQTGESNDPKTALVLGFARKLVDQRGHVGATAVNALREAGLSDEAVVEIVAHVALNLFTNYINVALGVEIDFPAVPLRQPRPS